MEHAVPILSCDGRPALNRSQRRILVTGFQPFGGESCNPSEILLQSLKGDLAFNSQVEFLLLPVSFKESVEVLENAMLHNHFDAVFLLGQAGGRKSLSLERVALNWCEAKSADEVGFTPRAGGIVEVGPAAYFSSLPLDEWKAKLEAQGIPAEVSLSAGGFVCNHLYFWAQHLVKRREASTEVLFIHVPYLPDQVIEKPGQPSMELSVMLEGVKCLLQWGRRG